MSNEYAATHANEFNGVLYSASEMQTFRSNLIDAQRQALADAIVAANPNLVWQSVYNQLQPVLGSDGQPLVVGGNANFTYTGPLNDLSFIPNYLSGGCEVQCRFGGAPAIHMHGNYQIHLDNGNPLWGFGVGALIHGVVDVILGNINGSFPMPPW
jgi:hypothetical protein